jgi:caspase domain-containing protein
MKYALIIGNNKYNDPKLAQLKTPAADSQALAKVLDDKTIGSFDEVTPLVNQTETRIRRAISTFLTNKKPDDLVLLYFSGHGVLDDRGRLYLALRDTQVDLLKATSIPSSFIADEMDSCRSKRQILVLDCCHSGAFGRGTKGEQKAVTETTFEGSGFGRVVLTASDSTQYALEGDQVIKQTELSLFTHFLLEGLKTGEADVNNDGQISLDEWYDYTYAKVVSETPRQVPHKWSYNQQGDLIIARNPYVKKRVVELPYELLQALDSSFVGIRESAVTELGKYLRSRDPEMVELAVSSLEKMKGDDSRRISLQAERLLAEFEQTRAPSLKRGMPLPKPVADPVSETADVASESSQTLPIPAIETESPLAREETSRPEVENLSIPADRPSVSQEFVFDRSFWLKWIGTTLAAVVFSFVFYWYNYSNSIEEDPLIVLEFAAVAGLSSLIQWLAFRDRLKMWWVGANTITGFALGLLQIQLYNIQGLEWWIFHLRILLAVWLVGNFALGRKLIGET